jgi:hypothetical protein
MRLNRKGLVGPVLLGCASMVMAILISTPLRAQQKAIVIGPNAISPSAKALTVLSRPGSYVLARNIVNSRAGVDSVDVTASNVTIDLQGFTIMSTNSSTGAGINCTGQTDVVIRNGTISGHGGTAIIGGNATNISGIIASGNGIGISCGAACLVSNNVVQGNTGKGMIFLDTTSGFLGNVMQGNDSNTSGATGQVSGGTSLGQNLCNGTTC